MTMHEGGCHCGKVRFKVETDLQPLIECNCSYCQKRGSILTFVPEAAFTLVSGEEAQTEYRFNTEKIQHLFCKHCGVESFGRGAMPDGTMMVAVNVACLDGIDAASLQTTPFDGRSL